MSDFQTARKPLFPREAETRRRALALIRPFVDRFDDWNHRAAMASARALSHQASARDRATEATKLAELATEVETARQEFELAVSGELRHGRIDDLRAAFARLQHVLEHWRNYRV